MGRRADAAGTRSDAAPRDGRLHRTAGRMQVMRVLAAVALAAGLSLPLTGCLAVVYGFEVVASVATVADRVFDIDVSWKQSHPDKTQIMPVVILP